MAWCSRVDGLFPMYFVAWRIYPRGDCVWISIGRSTVVHGEKEEVMGLFERKSCWKKIEGRVGLAEVEFATSLEIGISFLSNLYKVVISLSEIL